MTLFLALTTMRATLQLAREHAEFPKTGCLLSILKLLYQELVARTKRNETDLVTHSGISASAMDRAIALVTFVVAARRHTPGLPGAIGPASAGTIPEGRAARRAACDGARMAARPGLMKKQRFDGSDTHRFPVTFAAL